MPLIILTGYPCSGKTTKANELKKFFEDQGKEVHVLSEYNHIIEAGFEKNNFYQDSRKEKEIRGLLKSEVQRLISPRNVVILDSANYIKGYRYELYCATKANHSTQCTIYPLVNQDVAWEHNEARCEAEKYTRKTFDELIMRYEEPEARNRWDAPLFIILPEGSLDLQAISDCLFEKKAPAPNMSTQNPPLSSTNFLYDMNKIVKEITTAILGLLKGGCAGVVPVPGYTQHKIDLTHATVPQVISLSKQYLIYSKMHTPDIKQVPHLYITYLGTNIK